MSICGICVADVFPRVRFRTHSVFLHPHRAAFRKRSVLTHSHVLLGNFGHVPFFPTWSLWLICEAFAFEPLTTLLMSRLLNNDVGGFVALGSSWLISEAFRFGPPSCRSTVCRLHPTSSATARLDKPSSLPIAIAVSRTVSMCMYGYPWYLSVS
jgi:hypothetical protein